MESNTLKDNQISTMQALSEQTYHKRSRDYTRTSLKRVTGELLLE